MTAYRVEFDRISRSRNVAPLTVITDTPPGTQAHADEIARQVYRYASPKCGSRDLTVTVDLEAGRGTVHAGFHTAGNFTIAEDDAATEATP